MKRNPFYKTLQALALLLLALATMASAATGLDTDPDTQELYVNMPVIGMNEVEITADDIANGLTSFMVYDDGGKAGDYSSDADGYLTVTAPEGYVLQVSGTETYGDNGRLSVYDGENSQATPLLDDFSSNNGAIASIGKRISTGNVMTFYFRSTYANGASEGLNLKVDLLKTELSLAEDGEGGYYVNMLAQNTATLNISAADIAKGVTSFNLYDDGGKDGEYSYNADGYLTITAPEGYVLQVSGTVTSYGGYGCLSVFDGGNSQASPLLNEFCESSANASIGKRLSTDNVMTFYFHSTYSETLDGLNLKVDLLKTELSLAEDGEGGYYVNMLAQNTATLNISAADIAKGVTSFNLYDDGGKDGEYSYNADGCLTITAPEGYVLQVSGRVKSYYNWVKLSVFDGENSQTTPLLSEFYDGDIGTRISTGNVMTFYFQSTSNSVSDGLDLTVKAIKMNLSLAEDGEGGYYVNMLAQNTATLDITADDIANGITSFKLYDDGGKDGKYSYSADGYLTVTVPEGYVLQVSGTVASFNRQFGKLSIYDGENSQTTPLLRNFTNGDIGKRISTGNIVTFYFLSESSRSDEGLDLTVDLLKTELNLAKEDNGDYYVNMLAQNMATLNITADDIANGVTSFMVYDDGGKDGNHSRTADGYLTITVPKDYVLQLTEKVLTYYGGNDRSFLSVFDGNATASPLLSEVKQGYGDGKIDTTVSTGNVMTLYFKSKDLSYTAPGLELKATLVRRGFGAVTITKAGDGKFHATIDGNYSGTETLSILEAIEVDAVDYNRELEEGIPATALLPVTLPEGTVVNADFYTLEKVEQVGDRWQATMTYIGDGKLPQPNTPYAVILHEGETKLEFDLKGEKATVQTGKIQNVCSLDNDCQLDENKQIKNDWYFTGTYAYKEWKAGDGEIGLAYAFAATDNPGGAAKGKFGRIVAGAFANPMRSYLRKRDADVKLVKPQQAAASSYVARYSVNYMPETIDVEFVKDDKKGGRTVLLGRMNTVSGEFKMLHDFDLKGRKVNSANKARGAYYGKKVLKK